jgi:hypothetical protein
VPVRDRRSLDGMGRSGVLPGRGARRRLGRRLSRILRDARALLLRVRKLLLGLREPGLHVGELLARGLQPGFQRGELAVAGRACFGGLREGLLGLRTPLLERLHVVDQRLAPRRELAQGTVEIAALLSETVEVAARLRGLLAKRGLGLARLLDPLFRPGELSRFRSALLRDLGQRLAGPGLLPACLFEPLPDFRELL